MVSGKENYKTSKGDCSNKEFMKTYELPENCEPDKMVSFMTIGDRLVIEFPSKGKNQFVNIFFSKSINKINKINLSIYSFQNQSTKSICQYILFKSNLSFKKTLLKRNANTAKHRPLSQDH